MKYGLEIYAPVGPGGHFLDTVELFGGQRVFDANPNVEEALKERGRLWHREPFQHSVSALLALPQPGDLPGDVAVVHRDGWHRSRALGGAPRAGRDAARRRRSTPSTTQVHWMPDVGTRPHLQHDREPPRLVHLAPARLGRADPGGRLHEVRRSAADAGARRARGGGLRHLRRRRLVRAADRGVHPRRADLPVVRRHRRSSASATSSTSGSTPARATKRCCRSGPS